MMFAADLGRAILTAVIPISVGSMAPRSRSSCS